jgi:hypothetical protein
MPDALFFFAIGFPPVALTCLGALERWAPYLAETHPLNRCKRGIRIGSRILLVLNLLLLAGLLYVMF